MTDPSLSFYDWCAAAWLHIYQRYAFDDDIADDIEIWRRAFRAGEYPEEFAGGYAEERCNLEPDPWNQTKSGRPSEVVPFPASAFDEKDLQLDLFEFA